jgi:hypothetical protein
MADSGLPSPICWADSNGRTLISARPFLKSSGFTRGFYITAGGLFHFSPAFGKNNYGLFFRDYRNFNRI